MVRRLALPVLAAILVSNVLGAGAMPGRISPASGTAYATAGATIRLTDPYPPVPEYSGTVTLYWDTQVTNSMFFSTTTHTGSVTLQPVRGDTVRKNDPPNGLEFAVVALSSRESFTDSSKSCSWTHTLNANGAVDGLFEPISFYTRPGSWLSTLDLRVLPVVASGQCTDEEPRTFLDTVDLQSMASGGIELVNQVDTASARYRILSDSTASMEGGTTTATVRAVVDLRRLDPSSAHSQYPTVQVTANVPPPKGFDAPAPGWVYDKVTIRSNPPVARADVRQYGERGRVRADGLSTASYITAVTDEEGVLIRVALRESSEFPPCYSADIIPHNGQTVAGQSDVACAGDEADVVNKIRTKLVERFKSTYPRSRLYRGKFIVRDSASKSPTGKVVVKRGKLVVGKGVIKSGRVALTLRGLVMGRNRLTARYAGDAGFKASNLRFVITVK